MADDDDPPPRADIVDADVARADDPQDQRRRRRRKESFDERKARFWREVFADEIGRRCMWEILQAVDWLKDPFTTTVVGFPDERATWFNAGRHGYARTLFMSWLRLDRDGVLKMLDEHDPRFVVPKR